MKVYIVKNQSNQYFRAKGRDGYGETWVSELENAKIYTKIGQAKSRVTYFYKSYPQYGCPVILEFELANPNEIDMKGETDKKILRAERQRLQRTVKYAKEQKESIVKEINRLTEELKKIN